MNANLDFQGPVAKRYRAARACDMCRLKKNKCDERSPCTLCKNRNTECVYRGIRSTWESRIDPDYVQQLEEKIQNLSSALMLSKADGTTDPPNPYPTIVREEGVINSTMTRLNSGSFTWCKTAHEVGVLNRHTHSFEFYGGSSSVAMLARIQSASSPEKQVQQEDKEGLVSSLHNPVFSPVPTKASATLPAARDASALLASTSYQRLFVDGFFATVHYIYPMLCKATFLDKCELIWAGEASRLSSSFTALYYSVLSLGALLRPREEEPIGDMDNARWSRKFFDEARERCNSGTAKVCQNALNLHWAYLHIGTAVRIALSIGINREPSSGCEKDPELLKAESRTWWCLYFLETEMSFSIGRPDSLGADVYHNRRYPITAQDTSGTGLHLLEPPHCAFIEHMVDFSRIMKAVGLKLYMVDLTLDTAMLVSGQIEQDLEKWVEGLPRALRPLNEVGQKRPLKAAIDPPYVKRQRLATTTRYHNLRILLFGHLLTRYAVAEGMSKEQRQEKITKCLTSARLTIEIVYDIFQNQDFFRTWFYNTTYTIYAASIILIYVFETREGSDLDPQVRLVEMAIEILETMEESVVAAKAAKLIHSALARARPRVFDPKSTDQTIQAGGGNNLPDSSGLWSPLFMADDNASFGLPLQFGEFGSDSVFDDITRTLFM